MRTLLDKLDQGLRALVVVLVFAMLAALALQVGMRYLGGRALSWSEELALLAFSWVVVLASALGIRHGLHARMAVLVERLPGKAARALEAAMSLLIATLGVAIAAAGWEYVQETRGMTSASIGYPIELLHAAAPAFGVLVAVFALERAICGAALDSSPDEAVPGTTANAGAPT